MSTKAAHVSREPHSLLQTALYDLQNRVMNIALAWLLAQVNGKHKHKHRNIDSFPDLEACIRDPNCFIDQKFIDWVIARDSSDPPDYMKDLPEDNIFSGMRELHVNANAIGDIDINNTESYLDGTNQTDDTMICAQENVDKWNKCLYEMKSNLDENKNKVTAAAKLSRAVTTTIHTHSRRTRNLKRKKSNSYDKKLKHRHLEVANNVYRSHSSKYCMPLREIQEAPNRSFVEESFRNSTARGESETRSSSFSFNGSVFQCAVDGCGKLYRRRSHLQSHLRRHTGERPYPCTWQGCKWKFSRSDELVRHMRSHSGDKPFHCTTCSKRFARSDHLKKHLRVHQKALID